MTFRVKSKPAVRGRVGACGLDRPGIVRLWNRVTESLAVASDAIRAGRSLKQPDCFVFHAGIAGLDANYWFHFLVNDREETGTLIVQNVVCEKRPKPEDG